MTDYTTVTTVKDYLRISSSSDDSLLGDFVVRASRMIEDFCGRWFDARAETRYFDATGSHITGNLLLLDADLLSITTLVNGDGTTISADDIILRPINWPPYFGIALRHNSGLRWTYVDDPRGAISITGLWGYASTVPEPVRHAATRLAIWLYRQRDHAQAVDEADGGHLPRDVRSMLLPYVRLRMRILG